MGKGDVLAEQSQALQLSEAPVSCYRSETFLEIFGHWRSLFHSHTWSAAAHDPGGV